MHIIDKYSGLLKVLHVAPAYFPATYWGGPTFSTYGLCNALARREDMSVSVLTTDSSGPNRADRLPIHSFPERYEEGYDVYLVRKSGGKDIAPRLLPHLYRMVREADLIHLTATYSFPTLPTFLAARRYGKPLVWSPRGAIQATTEWSGARRRTLKHAWARIARACHPTQTLIHATADVEKDACAAVFPGIPAVVIPNGVDLPAKPQHRDWRPNGRLRLIYLSRLDVKKGLENLFDAIDQLPAAVTLDVYGTGEEVYLQSLKAKVSAMGLSQRVCFHGHVEGRAKSEAFANADLFVLPSYSENFGIVVAEALAHGVPAIASLASPWEGLVTHKCGLWVDNTPISLSKAIESLTDADLPGMGIRGREWARVAFAWDALAADLADAYKRLAGHELEVRR